MTDEKPNKHIEAYLTTFLSMQKPEFAVMIEGPWGSGKSYFVQKFIEKYDQTNRSPYPTGKKATHFCHVSLYGVEKTDEIDKRLFLALHPKLNGEYTDLVAHAFSGALSLCKGDKFLEKLTFKDFTHALKDKVLVFDDFERCGMSPEKTLSYINTFVEHKNIHIIVISNDEEVKPADVITESVKVEVVIKNNTAETSEKTKNDKVADTNKSKYDFIREKVIGRTFRLANNSKIVIPELIKKLKNEPNDIFDIAKRNEYLLISTFDAVNSATNQCNYRAFMHALRDWEYILLKVDPKHWKNPSLMRDFMHIFVAIAYEKHLGIILFKGQSFRKFHGLALGKRYENAKINKKNEDFFARHNLDMHNLVFPALRAADEKERLDLKLWSGLFSNLDVNFNQIDEAFSNSLHYAQQSKDFITLWHYRYLSDEEFWALIEKVRNNRSTFQYKSLTESLHLFAIFIELSNKKAITESAEDIKNQAIAYFTELMAEGTLEVDEWCDIHNNLFSKHHFESSHQLMYYARDTKEFRELINFLSEEVKNYVLKSKSESVKFSNEMFLDVEAFCKRLVEYYDLLEIPLSTWISGKSFFELFLKIPNCHKDKVLSMVDKRIEGVRVDKPFADSGFYLELMDEVEHYLEEHTQYTPTRLQVEILKGEIKTFVERFKEQAPEESDSLNDE